MRLHVVAPGHLYAGRPYRDDPASLEAVNSETRYLTFENAGKFTLPDALNPTQPRHFVINVLLSIIGWMRAQDCDDLRFTLTSAALLSINAAPMATFTVYSVCIFRHDYLRTSAATIVGNPDLLNPEDPSFWTFNSIDIAEIAEYLQRFLQKTLHMFARMRHVGRTVDIVEPNVRLIFEPDDRTELQHTMPEKRSEAIKPERSPSPLSRFMLKRAERFRSPRHVAKHVDRANTSRRKRALPGH